MSVPNQKFIGSINLVKCNGQDKYTMIDKGTLEEVMQDLPTLNALKLWLYLSSNRDGWKMELSSQDYVNRTGGSRSQFSQSFAILLEKGYLVLREGTKATYDFYQSPSLGNCLAASQITIVEECPAASQMPIEDICLTASQLPTYVSESGEVFRF